MLRSVTNDERDAEEISDYGQKESFETLFMWEIILSRLLLFINREGLV